MADASDTVGMAPPPSHELDPYVPRRIAGLGLWDVGPLRLKAYGIRWRDETISPRSMDAARTHVAERLPPAAAEEGHEGVGFVIVHEAPEDTWLLMDWWAHGEICCQLMSRRRAVEGSRFEAVSVPYLACVWEAVVIKHERDAWVSTMLTENPDPEAYLSCWLPSGQY